MKTIQVLLVGALFLLGKVDPVRAQGTEGISADVLTLQNPMSLQYLKTNLRKTGPRLVLTPSIEKKLKAKIKSDAVVLNYYAAIKLNADQILPLPLLTRKMEGRRLLDVSREMLYRMNTLSMVYRIEKDPVMLKRIDDEVKAVCNFSDWNPSHYLDVAEMSMAVAIAVDWVGDALPKATVELAITSLIEKGIKPSYPPSGVPGWVNGTNNWNQVCNGGMIAASIIIADRDPELAAKTIGRSLAGIPNALKQYGPDGLYPEGATYWSYGTSFSVVTSSMLMTSFGTDFGISAYPAFLKSADFRLLSVAPSGWYYNFADCGDHAGSDGDVTLAWFAKQTGNPVYLEREKYLQSPKDMGKLSRLAGSGLVWLSQFESKDKTQLPVVWKGEGTNPVVIFRDDSSDPRRYYFGGKGGRATVSHGNMDAGSFIFELDGIRWVVDPGNQSYHEIEKTGFDLWGNCQHCQRWTLLTKNNYGHSTITVNNALHVNNGFASIINYQSSGKPEVTFDLSPVFGSLLKSSTRRFVKEDNHSLLVEDNFQLTDSTEVITWQLMTTADVQIVKGGAVLRQGGKELKLENLSHPELNVSIISLDPPPLELDRKIDGLKRVEIRLPAYLFTDKEGILRVRLSSN